MKEKKCKRNKQERKYRKQNKMIAKSKDIEDHDAVKMDRSSNSSSSSSVDSSDDNSSSSG